ncbi:Methionine import system permease protein MetP [Aedoeadaptatus ivorii]|uniref:Methionine import system permease protein MetP n=1 Tax=Aedoeadaptatus ivorii TaxID=54006 RepID=A0A3S5AIH3_9FIRM|nr:ABC transporter permease subunit [Peptoniphilus ivorii]MDQ0507965.1 D-methionine transport system permease protein [Peptoniphilus ivorii]VEJ34791.1 Methionine import system permease protein MetP [Peptoniphilus ivorii]
MLSRYFFEMILPAFGDTLKMIAITMCISIVLGGLAGMAMMITHPSGLEPDRRVYGVLSFFVNTIRSLPFILLVVILAPLTRLINGSIVGIYAAIIPMSIGGIPLVAKLLENEFLAVQPEVIEAAISYGASKLQIFFYVVLKESVPGIINGLTLATISCVGATAMAGAVGAGGLGAVALNQGFYSYNNEVLYLSVSCIILIIVVIQKFGNILYKLSIR